MHAPPRALAALVLIALAVGCTPTPRTTPAASSAKVIISDQSAGNFSQPKRSATKIFDPMNTSSTASAYFR